MAVRVANDGLAPLAAERINNGRGSIRSIHTFAGAQRLAPLDAQRIFHAAGGDRGGGAPALWGGGQRKRRAQPLQCLLRRRIRPPRRPMPASLQGLRRTRRARLLLRPTGAWIHLLPLGAHLFRYLVVPRWGNGHLLRKWWTGLQSPRQ